MTVPTVQQLGAAVLLQGAAVPEISYLVGLGVRYRANLDGAAPSVRQRQLLRILADAAEATLAAPATGGHADIPAAPHLGESVVGVGTAEVASVLGVTARHVRRLAADLDGRRVKGAWRFERAAVIAYRAQLREETK